MKGIYQYTDLENGDVVYVGKDSHIDKEHRRKAHKRPCMYDSQPFNRILQNNPERYRYEVIYAGDFDEDLLNVLEINTIAEKNPKFNFTKGGDGTIGYKHTDETKQYLSDIKNGVPRPKEVIEKIRKGNTGKKLSKKTREKMSKSRKGENNGMYGKNHTENTKKKMSENHADFSNEKHPKYRHDLPSNEDLLNEYLNKNITQTELAKKYNCSQKCINDRLVKAREV